MDLFSRHVLSWKLSNSLDTEFCLDALEMALSAGRKPEIFHSDQGCQFTSADFVARLQMEEIKISWSGRKRCYDNILVERLWRTVKYEEVYLRAYSDGWEAEISLARFLWRYCHVRPHSSLGGRTPYEVYTETEPCSSRPGLTMSGTRTVQEKAPTSAGVNGASGLWFSQESFEHLFIHSSQFSRGLLRQLALRLEKAARMLETSGQT